MSDTRTVLRSILTEDKLPGGLGDNAKTSSFCPYQIAAGMAVEAEHTDDSEKALEIVKDHLTEDPRYYGAVLPTEEVKDALQTVFRKCVAKEEVAEHIGISGLSGDNPGAAMNFAQPPSYKPAGPGMSASGKRRKKRKNGK